MTVHGWTGDIIQASTGARLDVPVTVDVDQDRRQVHLCVPFEAFDPSGVTVRVAAGTGLWDMANNRYLLPGATATATTPGGAGNLVTPPAFFNAAFRYGEPLNGNDNTNQGTVLRTGDMSPFYANVDFTALQRQVNDDMPDQLGGVPQTGYMNRILASHFESKQGRGICDDASAGPLPVHRMLAALVRGTPRALRDLRTQGARAGDGLRHFHQPARRGW